MAGLLAVMVVLAPMSLIFAMAMQMLVPAMQALTVLPAQVASAMSPLIGTFTGLVAPATLLVATLTPLVVVFAALLAAAIGLLAAMAGLMAIFILTATSMTLIVGVGRLLFATFVQLSVGCRIVSQALSMLPPVLTMIIAPLLLSSANFLIFSAALAAAYVSTLGINTGLASMAVTLTVATAALTVFSALGQKVPSVFNNMKRAQSDFVSNLNTLPNSFSRVAAAVISQMNRMVSAIRSGCSSMQSIMRSAMSSLYSIANSVNLYSAGVNIMSGLNSGLNAAASSVLSTARSIADSVSSTINSALKIHSPSKVTTESGWFTGMGVVKGMKNSLPLIDDMSREVGYTAAYGIDDTLGDYSPESSTTTNNTTSNEYNTYSPQFIVHIDGGGDEKALERKFKRWFSEALSDTFDSIGRSNPDLVEV